MTIDAATPALSFTVAGTGPYGLAWPYVAGGVTAFVVVDGAPVALTPGTDFTLSPASSTTGGNLTLSAGAATTHAGRTLLIERLTAPEQGWAGTGARERGLEGQIDAMVMEQQELRLRSARALRAPAAVAPFIPSGPDTTMIWTGTGFASGPSLSQIEADLAATLAAAAAAGASEDAAAASAALSDTARIAAQAARTAAEAARDTATGAAATATGAAATAAADAAAAADALIAPNVAEAGGHAAAAEANRIAAEAARATAEAARDDAAGHELDAEARAGEAADSATLAEAWAEMAFIHPILPGPGGVPGQRSAKAWAAQAELQADKAAAHEADAEAAALQATGYATRASFVVADGLNPGLGLSDGQTVRAAGLLYLRQASATAIADLPGWVPAGMWTPRHFAAAWNGTTDDAPAIQAAINALAAAGGGDLLLPDGSFKVNAAILPKSGVHIRAQSPRATMVIDNAMAPRPPTTNILTGFYENGISDFSIKGITVSTSGLTLTGSQFFRLFDFDSASDFEIAGIKATIPGTFSAFKNATRWKNHGHDITIATTGARIAGSDGLIDHWNGGVDGKTYDIRLRNQFTGPFAFGNWAVLVTATNTDGSVGTPFADIDFWDIEIDGGDGIPTAGIHLMGRTGGITGWSVRNCTVKNIKTPTGGTGSSTVQYAGWAYLFTDCEAGRYHNLRSENTRAGAVFIGRENTGTIGGQSITGNGLIVKSPNLGGFTLDDQAGACITVQNVNTQDIVLSETVIEGAAHTYCVFVGSDVRNLKIGVGVYPTGTVGRFRYFDVSGTTFIENEVFAVFQGYCVKRADGTMTVFKTIPGQGPITTANGSNFISANIDIGLHGVTFADVPARLISVTNDAGAFAWIASAGSNPTATDGGQVVLVRPTSLSNTQFNVHARFDGFWRLP